MCACRAPEQVNAEFGLRGSHTDVWGFATTVLHLATGHLPYQGLTHLQIMFAMSKGRTPEVPPSLPMWLQQALNSCLSFNTAARPSVSQLRQVRCAQVKPFSRLLPSDVQVLSTHPLVDPLVCCRQIAVLCSDVSDSSRRKSESSYPRSVQHTGQASVSILLCQRPCRDAANHSGTNATASRAACASDCACVTLFCTMVLHE